MSMFTPSGAYQQELDIRCSAGQVPGWARPLIEGRPPNGTTWLVVMGRRAGKTWLASGIDELRDMPASTHRVDLRASESTVRRKGLGCLLTGKSVGKFSTRVTDGVLLIDEPALSEHRPETSANLARGLEALRGLGVVPVVFATPHEYSALIGYLGPDAKKDVVLPPSLTDDEVGRMTARAPDWAPEVAESLRSQCPSWLQTPFLLELVLYAAETVPELRSDMVALTTAAVDIASQQHQYREQLFDNGLNTWQRQTLRASRWRAAGVIIPGTVPSGVLDRTPIPNDPVLAAHLPEVLRLHHVSDLHQGGELRSMVDAKDKGSTGQGLARLAGAGTPLDSYMDYIRWLAAEGKAPHLLLVSGDIVNRGGDNAQGEQALIWLRNVEPYLANHPDLGPMDPRIVLVGGNHDVAWDHCLDKHRETRHQWFATTFADYPHPDLHVADHSQRRLFVNYNSAGLRIALLGSAESGGEPARDADRENVHASLRQLASADAEEDVRKSIRAIERVDPGVVAREILDRLRPREGYLTLAALHHPVSPVPTVEVSPYSGIVNAGHVKQALASAATALVLHGHTHLSFLSAERLLGIARPWTLRIAGAATLSSTETSEQNGFNEIFIAREGRAHRLLVRPVRLDGGQWIAQAGMPFQPGAPSECTLLELASDP